MLKKVLAFDFGASSGRAMLGEFDGNSIKLTELHRFSNDPVMLNGTFFWDTIRLLYEIKQGIIKAKLSGGFDSIGINTWGVDFGLLDKDGYLLESSVNYRDSRTNGMLEKCASILPLDKLYEYTGNQIMQINTVFQLLSLTLNRPDLLKRAETLLMTPDLFNFLLTGEKATEYSIASTSQLLNPLTKKWNYEVIDKLGLPKKLFTKIVSSGTVIGKLSQEICDELSVESCSVISVASHDTASAVVATPALEKDFIFISCGTWSLFGTELSAPIINEKSAGYNLTNEGGYGGTTRFLKNIIGLWLIQESRRQWQREGNDYSYAELEKHALTAKPFVSFIDPDSTEFVAMGDIPKRVCEFCEKTGQAIPKNIGEIMICIYQSLALKYRYAYEQICDCTEKTYNSIHFVGGGAKDKLLCQMTANACNTTVIAGPIEATVLGNIAVQLISLGAIENLSVARKLIADSEKVVEFLACDYNIWNSAYERFKKIIT